MSYPQSTVPSSVSQARVEDITWGVDTTALLAQGQTPSVVSVVLADNRSGQTVVLADQPVLSGNVVAQRVRAGVLTAGHTYTLTAVVAVSGSTNELACQLVVVCPF